MAERTGHGRPGSGQEGAPWHMVEAARRILRRLNRGSRDGALPGKRARGTLLAIPALISPAMISPALASPALAHMAGGWLEPHVAVSFAFVGGAAIFVLTTAIVYRYEKRATTRREEALRAELAELRGAHDRAEILIGSESQIVISWESRDTPPRIEGDPTTLGTGIGGKRILAFGAWLSPVDAAALETAIGNLRERGEGFRLTLRTTGRRFIDAEGRALGGIAILRLRDVTGERAELMRVRREMAQMRGDLDKLRAVLDVVDQPVWLRDGEGGLGWANRAYLAAVEAESVEDARARKLELLDSAARAKAATHREAGKRFSARLAAIVAGSRRMLDVTETPSPGGAAGVAIDVSEVEELRADLNRQMDAHVRTLDQLPTAVAIFDASQHLAFHNTAYRQLWGLDQAFLESGPSDTEILDRLRGTRKLPEQADFRSWKNDVLSAYRSIEPRETWWHLPDGRTLRVVANPNPRGGLTYLFDDVSDHIKLESRFNALMRVQGETLDTLAEGVAVFGSDGRLRLANNAFRRLWALPETLVEESPHLDAVISHCRQSLPAEEPWAEIRSAVAGGEEGRTGFALRMERGDGMVLDCAGQPLPDGAMLLTFIDVTASVNVERALTEKNEALERAAQLRDDFVHHVSYELRSPLTTIIGFTQLLGEETVGALNERQREYADHIMRSSGALLAIINDILDLASIDTGSLELAPGEIDIRETIDSAVRGLEDRIAESEITLDIDVAAQIGSFTGDGKRIRQVLFNLLSNAIGFSDKGGRITVSARRNDGEISFSVADEGRGIPDDVAERVFERFESHTRGTAHRGVGLGLSIVRSFVELHGGRVDLHSRPGNGTTVTCVFPADGPRRMAAE